MRIEKRSGQRIQKILIGMITSKEVCAAVAAKWESPGLFEASWANLLATWAIQHFRKFEKPIGRNIETRFAEWAEDKPDSESARQMETLLVTLNEQYENNDQLNTAYLLDLAGNVFSEVAARRVIDAAEEQLYRGESKAAIETLQSVRTVPLGADGWLCPDVDYSCWEGVFDQDTPKDLIRYPGALGVFTEGSFARGDFVAWMGMDKVGKSFVLQDATIRALRNRCRVAYFECGDLNQEEVLIRLAMRAARRPQWKGTLDIPTELDEKLTEFESKVFDKHMTQQEAFRAMHKLTRKRNRLRIRCYPNGTLDVASIDAILDEWQRDSWVADVVVIDYADILAPPHGADTLEGIDQTWAQLRRLSQKRRALVLTATQANAHSYDTQQLLSRKNFSGRKTKLAHVTAMLGLNRFRHEHEQVIRWNWIVRRSRRALEGSAVRVAGNLEMACPVLKSHFLRKGWIDTNKTDESDRE